MTVTNLKIRKATQKFQPMISENLFILQYFANSLSFKIYNLTYNFR